MQGGDGGNKTTYCAACVAFWQEERGEVGSATELDLFLCRNLLSGKVIQVVVKSSSERTFAFV